MPICTYVLCAGARRGETCGKVVKVEGRKYCYNHMQTAYTQEKNADRIEFLQGKQNQQVRPKNMKPTKDKQTKLLDSIINDVIERQFKEPANDEDLSESTDELPIEKSPVIKQPFKKEPKKVQAPKSTFKSMDDDTLLEKFDRAVSTKDKTLNSIMLELKGRGIIQDREIEAIKTSLGI